MTDKTALIIDDEPDIRELLDITLDRMGITSFSAGNLGEAKQRLRERPYDICLTDMRLPDGDGVDFVTYLQNHYPNMPVAVITAHGSMEAAINALKAGAFDFITKPVDLKLLRKLVGSALNVGHRKMVSGTRLIGTSKAIEQIRKTIAKLARSQAPIYISGESGVGKELVARLIHEEGPRSSQAFVPVNCGAIPHELMESELFGHRKGSFTGADSDKQGLFQAAGGGTLFLDEIAEIPASMQVKLLRAIQEKRIRPVGENTEIDVDVRILSATHKNLGKLVEQGQFRQDLFYRINVIELPVPPLRERPEDIRALVEHILAHTPPVADESGVSLTEDAIDALQEYPFPGNVRELENILERALTLRDSGAIERDDLQLPSGRAGVPPAQDRSDAPTPDENLDDYLKRVEKGIILDALEKTKWNKTAAAEMLGVSFRALRYRLQKLGLE